MKDNNFNTKMNYLQPASRRIAVLQRVFSKTCVAIPNAVSKSYGSKYSGEKLVKIGDISKLVKPAKNPQYVPVKYVEEEQSQELLRHLRWMLQKDLLGQDMFLIGEPGPLRRQLAMQFLEITDRELEYVSLSRDTTEADLKQRREIKNGTAVYFDQCAVRAAVEGRILVLEGIEKAERNVLPVLNNLLENREMHLEDGRFLIPAKRYDQLLKEHGVEEVRGWRLERVSEAFRVVALGLPVPRYAGNPLDPPLRSRFQARHVQPLSYKEQLRRLRAEAPALEGGRVAQLLSSAHALATAEAQTLLLPDFPLDALPAAARLLESSPSVSVYDAIYRLYPYKSFLAIEGQSAVENVLGTFQVLHEKDKKVPISIKNITGQNEYADVEISSDHLSSKHQVPRGSQKGNVNSKEFVQNSYQEQLLADLVLSHQFKDICVIGPRGCGKSATVEEFAKRLNYVVEPIVLYQDMTSRDLIQQRSTLPNGDTVWQNSPLVTAALEGKLAILDGIHRIHPSTLAVIHRLVHDREMTLHDGTRLLHHNRYDDLKAVHKFTDEQLEESSIFRIHPSFRIIALAEPPVQGGGGSQWLSPEMLSLFLYHEMRPLSSKEEINLISSLVGRPGKSFEQVVRLAHAMRASEDPSVRALASSLSTRQLLRIARRMKTYPGDSPVDTVHRACLARFLPSLARQALDKVLSDENISSSDLQTNEPTLVCKVENDQVTIGKTTIPRYKTNAKTKIPDIQFFDVPQHISALEWLLQDFILGEHLLLIGNQGVGKNKLADRLLQLLNRPREYIQLHRDTTVQTLTLQPTVRDGVVVYEDSPLVQAVKLGHVLIVDEADKAPTHVTCILKTLVESGEMILSDGRRIVPSSYSHMSTSNKEIISIHPDFRMIVLANRPGFPFLGNDFFGALGDLFSCHAVDNPSAASEHSLLKQYGPDVSDQIISRLVKAFGELRNLADQGLVQYPYSTREVVNIVKHLQEFPDESLVNVIGNVFDFDSYSQEVEETLKNVLQKHGIPVKVHPNKISLAKEFPLPPLQQAGEWKVTHPNPPNFLAIEERFLKMKAPVTLPQYHHSLDFTEARGSVFSEMQSYWVVPVGETGVVAGITVSKGLENDPLKDWVHVLAMNPSRLFTMQPSGNEIHEVSLQGLFKPVRGNYPQFKMCSFRTEKGSNLLIHEETSNGLVLVDPFAGFAQSIPLKSVIEQTASSLANTLNLSIKSKDWKMLPDLLEDENFVVLFERDGVCVEAINIKTMTAYSISMPINIKSLHTSSVDAWLVEDTDSKKYLLKKTTPSDPVPHTLQPIEESSPTTLLNSLAACGMTQLSSPILSEAINKKIESPNRIFSSRLSSAVVAVGFPELELSGNELYLWPRVKEMAPRDSLDKTIVLPETGNIIRPIDTTCLPDKFLREELEKSHSVAGYLEVTDVINHKLKYIPVPSPVNVSPISAWIYSHQHLPLFVTSTSNDGLVTVDAGGCVRLWEVALGNLTKSLQQWRQLIGSDKDHIQLTIDKPSGQDVSSPKFGKIDEKGNPHVGGNTWAGGTGGRDTAGLGGKGGPYRLDAGHDVHQVSQEEKDAVPDHVKKAAHEMARKAFKERLKEIQMSEYDANVYQQYACSVSSQVQALRVILGSLQAKSKERQWLRHQTAGELDDMKLIEGLTGEKTIYRRRAEKEPELGTPQTKPKRLKFIVDVSGSMYRFNGYDGRLDREMEAVIMVMEAFQGYERQIQYDIVGHSGEDYKLQFVDHRCPPTDNKQRLDIIKIMHAHSQFCLSGDHTLEATKFGITELSKEDCDESIVVVLSDANLRRYGIAPESFSKVLTSEPNVSAYAIFIGSLGDEAIRLMKNMPAGRAFVCLDLTKLPQILQQIFSASVLNTR